MLKCSFASILLTTSSLKDDKSTKSNNQGTSEAFAHIPQELMHTRTVGNGTEFAVQQILLQALEMDIYFAHPSAPNERVINENSNGFNLEAQWTKNRKTGFIGLPDTIMQQLQTYINNQPPNALLLNVPKETSRAIKRDYIKAGIPIKTDEGKLDFHALRTTHITLVIESGATPKEAQVLARHSTIELTMNTYARTRQHRLNEITENVVNAISSDT